MTEFDLSKFKQSKVLDTDEELQEVAAMRQIRRIGEGIHEVVVTGLHRKEGQPVTTFTDKEGGTVSFNLIVKNAAQEEQIVYMAVCVAQTYKQVCSNPDKNTSFIYRNTFKNLIAMGIDPNALRSSIIETNGDSVNLLAGTQFTLTNSWPTNKLHLEYDVDSKSSFFVTSSGTRFTEGELSVPIKIDLKKDMKDRFSEAVAIVAEANFKLATQMYTELSSHPTVSNDDINLKLQQASQPPKITQSFNTINKTKPPFLMPKKITSPLEH